MRIEMNLMFLSLTIISLSGCGKIMTLDQGESSKLAGISSREDALFLAPGTIVNFKKQLTLPANSGLGLGSVKRKGVEILDDSKCYLDYENSIMERIIDPKVTFAVEKVNGKIEFERKSEQVYPTNDNGRAYQTSCLYLSTRQIFLKSKGGFALRISCERGAIYTEVLMLEKISCKTPDEIQERVPVALAVFEKHLTVKQPAPQVIE